MASFLCEGAVREKDREEKRQGGEEQDKAGPGRGRR